MNKKFTTDDFIKRAREVHGDKYDYSKVDYIDSKHNVTIICPEHGEFVQRANRHLQGSGCKKCSSKIRGQSQRFTTDDFIKRAREIHGDKYDYSKVDYVNNYTKVCVICPEHGEFSILPYAHINLKEGCLKCSNSNKPTTEEWVKKAREVHGDKYDYSKSKYINCRTKICIICPEHGEFWQRPNSHILGNGCPKCSSQSKKEMCSLTADKFIERAREIHGDKYDYSKVEYINNYTKVCIICPEHGEFWQTPGAHIYNFQGCPECKKSRMEDYTKLLLEKGGLQFEKEKTFEWLLYNKNMRLDFLCGGLGIECQGGQHFVPVAKYGGDDGFDLIVNRDKEKYRLCKEHGIDILYIIPYRYRNTKIFKEFYSDKKYVFLKNIDNELIKLIGGYWLKGNSKEDCVAEG